MTDLQCPARVLIVDPDAGVDAAAQVLAAERPAAVHHGTDVASGRAAERLCHALGVAAVVSPALDPGVSIAGLADALDDIADQYRGEAVAVLIPAVLTIAVLRDLGAAGLAGRGAIAAGEVLAVTSDAEGWRLVSLPEE